MPFVDESKKITKNIVTEIISMITSGEIKFGDRLPAERLLSKQFDVSRVSVREALCALEILGVIRTRRGDGSYIVDSKEASNSGMGFIFSLTSYGTDIEAIMDFRKMIELEAIRLIIQNCKDSRRLRLLFDVSLSNMEACIENEYYDGCIQNDKEFHEIIISETGNRLLQVSHQASMVAFEQKTGAGFMSFTGQTTKNDWVIMKQMHSKMADAIVCGNTELACRLMQEHIELVRYIIIYASE